MNRETSVRSLWLAVAAVVLGVSSGAQAGSTLSLRLTTDNMMSVYISTADNQLGTLLPVTGAGTESLPIANHLAPDGTPYQNTAWHSDLAVTYQLPNYYSGTLYLHVVAANANYDSPPNQNPAGFIASGSVANTLNSTATFVGGGLTLDTNATDWKVADPFATFTDAQKTEYFANNGLATPGTGDINYSVAAGGSANQWGWGSAVFGTPDVIGANGVAPWGNIGGISPSAQWIWSNPTDGTLAGLTPRFFTTAITYNAVPEAGTMLLGGCAIMPILAYRRRARAKKA